MYQKYENVCMILWTTSAFTCRILHRLQCVRSCRCLKVFFYQVNVINCAYFEQLNFAILTILGWTIWASERWNKMLECPKLVIHDSLSCGRIYARIRTVIKRILQETQHGARSAFIIHVCMSSHMLNLQDMWHTGHACMCIHHLYTEINLYFSMIYWPEFEDRFMPAWCLPVCVVFTDGA